MAQGYRAAGDLQRAVPAFEEAARRAPGSPIAAMQLGNALLEAGQPGKAEAVLRRATLLAPGDAAGWALLGRALLREGRGADARPALEKASSLDPELPEPHNDLGAVMVGAGDWAGAEREFRAALRMSRASRSGNRTWPTCWPRAEGWMKRASTSSGAFD